MSAPPCSKSPAHSSRSSTFASPISLGGDAPEGVGVCRAGDNALYWAVDGERAAADRWLGDGWTLAADGALERGGDVFLPFDRARTCCGSGASGTPRARAAPV